MEYDHGLSTRSRHTPDDLAAIAALAAACGAHEGVDLAFVGEMAAAYEGDLPCALYHDQGHLVGAVALQGAGEDLEATLLVHHAHRRRGIGRALLATIVAAAGQRGLPGLLLVGAAGAPSAAAFAAAVGARYRFSEERMALLAPPEAAPTAAPSLDLRPVTAADFPLFARVTAAVTGVPEVAPHRHFASDLARPDRRLYLAWHAGEPVGTVRASRQMGETHITTLGVLPAWRRRGLGRQILIQVIARLEADGWRPLVLEVATDNQRALALYHARGFRAISGFAYYHLALGQGTAA
jgi:ribosomal protein S18 acetylase RimI-like enzyme